MFGFSVNWFLGILTVELWVAAYVLVIGPEIANWVVSRIAGRRRGRAMRVDQVPRLSW